MDIGIAGSGPGVDALRAAFDDVSATVSECAPSDLAAVDLAAVVAPAGADALDRADDLADRLVAVEIGGVGGHPLDDVDASVSAFTPDSARFADLQMRVASTTQTTADRASGDRSAVRLAGAIAGRRAVALLAGDDLGGTTVEVNGASVAAERSFLPTPAPEGTTGAVRRTHRETTLEDSLDRAERALDERVGLLTQVGERESFPVPYYLASTADTTAFSDARAAEYAAGTAVDWDVAFMKALGEGLERYCAGVYRERSFTTATETARARPVPPSQFVTPPDTRTPGPDDLVQWVAGEALDGGETVSVPAAFVYHPPPGERYAPSISTGLGLGNSGVEALCSGLYEVIERDAAMISWYSTYEPLGLTVTDESTREFSPAASEEFSALVSRARAENLSVTTLLVTVDVDVPVVAAAVHREGDWPRFAVGSSADLDPAGAARGALAEALQNWMELRAMGPADADSESGAIGEYAAYPERARSFVDVERRIPAASVGPDEVPSGADELDVLVERVAAAGMTPCAVRLTTRDVERLGFEAVRVLVPEAQPLFTGTPFFGDRAESVPSDLGAAPRLDRAYHPYP